MIEAIIAWVIAIVIVGVIVGGTFFRRRQRLRAAGPYSSPAPDASGAQKVDAQIGELQQFEAARGKPGMQK